MGSRFRLLCVVLAVAGVAATAASSATPLPTLSTATVVGDRVTLTFSGAVQPGRGSWTVLINGRPVAARAVTSGRRVQLVLARAAYGDDTVRAVGRFLRARSGARMRIVDSKPANRAVAGCSDELGTVVRGAATQGPTDRETFISADRFDLYAVRVEFPDAPGRAPFGSVEPSTLDHWVRDLSYGRSSVSMTVRPEPLRLPRLRAEYTLSGAWGPRRPFFQDLVAALDGQVDFAAYDAVVVTDTAAAPRVPGATRPPLVIGEPILIAPKGQGITADGRELRHFAFGGSVGLLSAIRRLAGLPVAEASGWDVTAGTGEPGRLGLLAWHRRKLGWLTAREVRCLRSESLEVTLEPTWRPGGIKAVVVPTGATTAVVLENRQRQGLDAGLCAKGVLAYAVSTESGRPLRLLPAAPGDALSCGHNYGGAPYDFGPGGSTRVAGVVSFEVLDALSDGSYRLRISR